MEAQLEAQLQPFSTAPSKAPTDLQRYGPIATDGICFVRQSCCPPARSAPTAKASPYQVVEMLSTLSTACSDAQPIRWAGWLPAADEAVAPTMLVALADGRTAACDAALWGWLAQWLPADVEIGVGELVIGCQLRPMIFWRNPADPTSALAGLLAETADQETHSATG